MPVPTGATTGNVVVTVGGLASNGSPFTVTVAPTHHEPVADERAGGDVGDDHAAPNFGATQGTSTVTFNGTAATPTSWSATSIVVPVPTGATTGNVVVTVGGLASNGVAFTVTVAPSHHEPVADERAGGHRGDDHRHEFRGDAGHEHGHVQRDGGDADELVGDEHRRAGADGATTGNVVVTVGGLASNGSTFTVTVAPTHHEPVADERAGGHRGHDHRHEFRRDAGHEHGHLQRDGGDADDLVGHEYRGPGPDGATTGNVVVTVGGLASNAACTFTVTLAPMLTSLSPTSGPVGTAVTISGDQFRGDARQRARSRSTGRRRRPTTWSATSIVVPVPTGATTGNVVVTVGGLASNALTYTVTVAPTLTSLSPTSGPVGTAVTIAGTNFGATRGSSTVTFNGTAATPTSWSAASIAVPVPTGATTGSVVVTVGGLASNALTYTVTAGAPTVTASPTTVAAGDTLTVTWQNIATPTAADWLALAPVGAADGTYVLWNYTNGSASGNALMSLPAGIATGNYEVRLYANNTSNRLAVSGPVTVRPAGPYLTASPVVVAPGGTLTVAWQGITAPTLLDWVGLYSVGATDSAYLARFSTGGRAIDSGLTTIPGTVADGAYELRLFANNSMTRLAVSNSFSVAAGPGLSANATIVAPGTTLSFAWAGIAAPSASDSVALFPVGAPDASYVALRNTTGAASGSLGLSIPSTVAAGAYELRLFQNGSQRRAVSNSFKIGPTVSVTPSTAAPGGTITVTWAGIATPTATDWIALVPINAAEQTYVAWTNLNGQASGSMPYALPSAIAAGTYELRLYANGVWQRLGVSNTFVISGPAPTLSASPAVVTPTGSLTVAWTGIATPTVTDWVGAYAVGTVDTNYVARVNTTGQSSGNTALALPGVAAGTYELRLFANNTFTRLAVSNGFTVAAGPTLSASPTTVNQGSSVTATWAGIAAPTATDWVAIVPINSPDSSSVAFAYTNGVAAGSVSIYIPISVAAGTYELRLYSGNTQAQLAVSNSFTVTGSTSVSASPSSIARAVRSA